MAILIVEANSTLRDSLVSLLEADGYSKVLAAGTAEECLGLLESHAEDPEALPDCVILSSQLPDISGLECVRLIHSKPLWRDLPVIMLLEQALGSAIDSALQAGATDFIAQPVSGPILLARVRQSLALKGETDRRKEREKELLQVTARLQEVISSLQGLASIDALTGLANKRQFDEALAKEWRRMLRDRAPLSLILGDLDEFSLLNSVLGRVKGDDAMRAVALCLQEHVSRAADLVCRLDGTRFAVLLPNVNAGGASFLAERMRHAVARLELANPEAAKKCLTISFGVSSIEPRAELRTGFLLSAAEEALFEAKRKGRDCVEVNALSEE
jgi:diguanylate cyclase (GGDEF)-like protein